MPTSGPESGPTNVALVARYGILDRLPEKLHDEVVTCPSGHIVDRACAVLLLRDALLSGGLPEPSKLGWPESSIRACLLAALEASGIAPLCIGHPDMTDSVLSIVLEAITELERRDLTELERELFVRAWLARQPRSRSSKGRCAGGGSVRLAPVRHEPTERERTMLRRDALFITSQMLGERIHDRIMDRWQNRVEVWRALGDVLRELEGTKLSGRAAAEMVRKMPLSAAIELRKWLTQLPLLSKMLLSLGRGDLRADELELMAAIQEETPVVRPREQVRHVQSDGRVDIIGVERSDDLARMLPSEALLLKRPLLRKLWHAHRVERALATYDARAFDDDPNITETRFDRGQDKRETQPTHGPVLIVLDTSGSMFGPRETVAKAIVVQALAAASLDQRPVYLYTFAGCGEVTEHELGLDGEGLANALSFLTITFQGGTVVEEPLRRALARIEEQKWRRSDILLVTDGFLGASDDLAPTIADLRLARALRGVRLVTALVAPEEGEGYHEAVHAISDRVHDIPRWIAASRTDEA